jgi:8-oxo-dGTP pyrophosphatase MutT (NUDIX family)
VATAILASPANAVRRQETSMIRLAFLVVAPIVALFAFGEGPQQEYVNAGVLPYSRESGEIRVLLGFDPDPGAWADFVGVCTPGETPSDTAAREFVEETREAYPANDVLTRLRSLEPVEIGPTRIFLLEVPEIPAARLNRLSKSRNSEKTNYCWVPLVALLESIDDRGGEPRGGTGIVRFEPRAFRPRGS